MSAKSDLIARAFLLRDSLVRFGLERLESTRLRIGPVPGATRRTLAATSTDGISILISPKLALEPRDVQQGILMHEFGHAIDFLYPARVSLADDDGHYDLVMDDLREPSRRDLSKWKRRSDDEIELFADTIAERAFGVTIGYRGPCLLQSTSGGLRPRPPGLR